MFVKHVVVVSNIFSRDFHKNQRFLHTDNKETGFLIFLLQSPDAGSVIFRVALKQKPSLCSFPGFLLRKNSFEGVSRENILCQIAEKVFNSISIAEKP